YRSGTPGGLTQADVKKLSDLGIRTVCDLRTNEERAHEPNPYVAAHSDVTYWTRDYVNSTGSGDLGKVLRGDDVSASKTRAMMLQLYTTLPEDQADSYAQMFRFLAEGKTPLAFNCTAGKDRAGTAAALVLTLLGVPRETVLADYALSDKLVDYKGQMEKGAKDNPAYAALAKVPFEVVEPLLKSDPAYLSAALDALTDKYGSIDAFIEKRLGVTPEMRDRIRANLLVGA
ncbi:MAG: tyrosine-protein phosphatase, partial [Novosphingobium sp.]